MEDPVKRYHELNARYQKLSTQRAEVKGAFEADKAELQRIADEIRQAGFNPADLKGEEARLVAQAHADLDAYELRLAEAEAAMKKYQDGK